MAVTQTTDALLLVEIANHDCVILKYHTDECGDPCDALVPVYHKLSDDMRYKDIVFLQINADNNPVAKHFILDKKAPIITIYYKGRLLESRTVENEPEMESLLYQLTNERHKIRSN